MTRDTATQAEIEHRIGAGGRFSIHVADWDLHLVAGTDDIVRIRDAEGRPFPDRIEVDRGPDSLSIRQPSLVRDIGLVLGTGRDKRRLIVDVPERAVIDVQSASGDVVAEGLHGTQMFKTASGDLRLAGLAGDLTTETLSGDIALRVDGSVGLTVKTVSGDVTVEDGRVERLRLTTTSGDVHLTSELGSGPHAIATVSGDAILLSDRGLRITAVTVAGDLRSEVPHTSQGGPGRRSLVVGDGATELQFRSVSGDLRVIDPASGRAAPRPIIAPEPPQPPTPPAFPAAPLPAATETPGADDDDDDGARLEILRALEAGEIDVAEATDRLAGIDGSTDA